MTALGVPGAAPSHAEEPSPPRRGYGSWLVVGVMLGAALIFSPLAAPAGRPTHAVHALKSKSSSSPSASPEDALSLIEKSLQVSVDQLNSEATRVLSDGRWQAARDLDPKSEPRFWILERRSAGAVRAMTLRDLWTRRTGASSSGSSSSEPGSTSAPAASESPAKSESVAPADPSVAIPAPIKAYSLPLTFNAISRGAEGAEPKAIAFEAVVMLLNNLRYQEASHRFEAQIAIGLRDPADPESRASLANPLSLLISTKTDAVDPPKLDISALGDPQVVKIAAAAPGSPFYVTVGTIGSTGDKIEIPIERPQLTVLAAQREIEGWGLAKTLIQIQVPGLTQPGVHAITLSTTRGLIVPTPVLLDASGRGSAQLRSDGVGLATITAAGDPFAPAIAKVRFVLPVNVVIAMLAGAVLAWIVRIFAQGWWTASLVQALASSAILTAAYAFGIHWLKWAPDVGAGLALNFLVAALGAYLGMWALTRNSDESSTGTGGSEAEA
jgi:hypothetical protein